MRPAIALAAGARRQAAGRDHDGGRTTAEVSAQRVITEDRVDQFDQFERLVEGSTRGPHAQLRRARTSQTQSRG